MDKDKDLINKVDQTLDLLSEGISNLLMSMKNTEQRVNAIKKMPNPPSTQMLRIVKNKAIEKQDFETCEALKIYSEEKGIDL